MQVLGAGLQLHDAQVHEETGEPAADGDCQDRHRLGHGVGDHPPARALGGGGRQAEVTDTDVNEISQMFSQYLEAPILLGPDLVYIKIPPKSAELTLSNTLCSQ